METAQQAASEAIDVFYDPRRNVDHAGDLQRSHRLKGEMVSLMQPAEDWGRAELAADRGAPTETNGAEEEPSDRLADTPFGGLGA
ncbi:hypothetical protein LJR255_003889 [Pararhizobium sp. LjRoot255]|uniref:hypothetical protein n=1 Tax=Pararhizobium sp. LjRoot255 TaxID=3342298 RepID=UPI003ECD3E89